MDFTHDDSGSHQVSDRKSSSKLSTIKKQQKPTVDDDDDLLVAGGEDPDEDVEPDEDDVEPEPGPERDPDEDAEPDEDDEPEEDEESEPKAARKKADPLKSEMDKLVAESQRAAQLEAKLQEQERRAAQAELGAIKSYAALKQRDLEITRKELDEATELGEVSRQSELRDKYHDLRTELGQMAAYIQRQEQVLSQPAAPAPAPPPNPKAVAWAKKQKWWGVDKGLTGAAFAIDEDLISEGISPHSDEFYRQLDKRLKPYMSRDNQRRQTVAAVSTRTPPGGPRRKVKLDADQLEMARRLNVPPAEYAKYVDL
jgi:hypothetical protein